MIRVARVDVGDHVYHVINRAVGRLRIFDDRNDYELFLYLLHEAKEMIGMRILGYALMPNHWHLLLYPAKVLLSFFLKLKKRWWLKKGLVLLSSTVLIV